MHSIRHTQTLSHTHKFPRRPLWFILAVQCSKCITGMWLHAFLLSSGAHTYDSVQISYLFWHRNQMLYELEAIMMISLFLCRDGLISKDEMMAYFLRANPLLQCKMGPGFIHNFQEMTYLKPTFCEHCAGFVRADFIWLILNIRLSCATLMQRYSLGPKCSRRLLRVQLCVCANKHI